MSKIQDQIQKSLKAFDGNCELIHLDIKDNLHISKAHHVTNLQDLFRKAQADLLLAVIAESNEYLGLTVKDLRKILEEAITQTNE